jgi:hypothetical protein
MSHNKKQNVCINAKKVFDWVIRPVNVTKSYSHKELSELFDEDLNELCATANGCEPHFRAECKVFDVEAKEMKSDRQKIRVRINGEDVTLYKVKVLVSFKVKVIIFADGDKIKPTEPIDVCSVETFYLCAPKGTCVDATVLDGECEADFFCCNDTANLTLSADFCLDVQVTDFVKLEVEASYCNPRDEFPISDMITCRPEKEPKQCQDVFPGQHKR